MRETDRRMEVQEELEAKELALELSITATAIATPDGRLTYVNRAFLELWREESVQDVLGRDAASFHPDTEEAEKVKRAIRDTGSWSGPLPAKRRDGSQFTVLVSAGLVKNRAGDVQSIFATFIDISDRINTEAELRENEERFSVALEHNRSFVWECDETGLYTYVSKGCELVTGYTAQELTGNLRYYDLHPEETREEFRIETLERVQGGEHFHRYEQVFLRKGGSRHWLATSGRPLYDDTGAVRGYRGISTDVTELVTLQQDLKLRSEAMENSITGMSIVAPDGVLLYVNRAFLRMFGATTPEEVIGKEVAHFHADPGESVEFSQRLLSEGACSGEFLARRLDGSTFPVLFGAALLREPAGDIKCFMGTFVDVTGRVAAETQARRQAQRFDRLLAATPQGYWLVDTEAGIIDLNQAACAMLGYTREEMLGLNVCDIDVQEKPEETRERITRLLEHGYDRFETRHRKKDGSIIDVMASVTLLGDGESPHLLAFIEDISERKRVERLEKEREVALRANLVKDTFMKNITHELKTPLNAIMGFAQVMQADESLSQTHAGFTREITTAGNRLLALIDDILDFVKITDDTLLLTPESIDCEELIREALRIVEPKAVEAGIQLHHHRGVPDETGVPAVRADRARLLQVLLNLLTNAIVYNRPEGSVRVSAGSDGASVRVTVTDTGVGIPLEKQGDLFSSFNRLGREALDIEGSGLGLMHTKRLLELMGGTIGFQSTPGEGSTFWIELPRAVAPGEGPHPAKSSDPNAAPDLPEPLPGPARTSNPLVLYIEDNQANQKVMELVLQRQAQVRYLAAPDGETGIALARETEPALVLLDLNLPDMNGYEVLRALKNEEKTRPIPVIAVTASAQPEEARRAEEAGFLTVVTKPLDIPLLLRVLNAALKAVDEDREIHALS